MDEKTCAFCPWSKLEKACDGWYFLACYRKPYEGAWVKYIDCPEAE